MVVKKSRKQRGGKVAGYSTWNEYTISKYYQNNLKAGKHKLLNDMRLSYNQDGHRQVILMNPNMLFQNLTLLTLYKIIIL